MTLALRGLTLAATAAGVLAYGTWLEARDTRGMCAYFGGRLSSQQPFMGVPRYACRYE